MDTNIQQEKLKLAKKIRALWMGYKNKHIRASYMGPNNSVNNIAYSVNSPGATYSHFSVEALEAVLDDLNALHGKSSETIQENPTAQLHINAVVEFAPALSKFVLKQGASQIVIESGINASFLLQTHGGLIASPVTVSFVPAPKTFSGKFGQTWGNLSLVQQRYIEELEKKANLR